MNRTTAREYARAHPAIGRVAEISADQSRLIRYVFSDPSVARDGHTIAADAWRLDNFKRNPVFLWAHDSGQPPIGRVVEIGRRGENLVGAVEYARPEDYPFADTIFRLTKGGFLNATSVGWLPLDWSRSTDRNRPGGLDFTDVELIEISQVPVPAAPGALVTAREAGINLSPFVDWLDRTLDAPAAPGTSRKELEMLRQAAGAPKLYAVPKALDSIERGRRAQDLARAADRPSGGFESFGGYLQAIARAADPVVTTDARLVRAPTGLGEVDPSKGGFLAPTEFVEHLVGSIYEEAVLAPLCDHLPTDKPRETSIPVVSETSRADGSRWGGVFSYWVSEGDTVPPTLPRYQEAKFTPHKLLGGVIVTNELLADAGMLGAYVERGFRAEFSFQLDRAILVGPGAGMPLGIMGSGALITVAKDSGQTPATITGQNVENMWARLAAPCRRRAAWIVNEDAEAQLTALNLGTGTAATANALYMPAGAAGNAYPLLKGRPVLVAEQSPKLGTPGDIVLADLSQYAILDPGIVGALSLDVYFNTDQSAFRFTWRVDGKSLWASPVMSFNGSGITRSPFVALAQR